MISALWSSIFILSLAIANRGIALKNEERSGVPLFECSANSLISRREDQNKWFQHWINSKSASRIWARHLGLVDVPEIGYFNGSQLSQSWYCVTENVYYAQSCNPKMGRMEAFPRYDQRHWHMLNRDSQLAVDLDRGLTHPMTCYTWL